ncbi:CDP-alcohol phosphatidyltransferase family protein [Arthrobacter roseus]|uniref:CDP-alcohol phosphatidyltransferase family protein n=1 Tax=Arthrobacter roseus TaxID=136274 RepID=UPI001963B003|nr:CDP-alcohol phosphatidyltransferase family protein [Arthrobacter roseus]MBM7848168.1 cardiolipin synthase [Arthrobacter roseus]
MRVFGAGQRPGVEPRLLTVFWTVPNLITVVRFLLVPVFVWLVDQEHYGRAVIALVILGATDWVDGYVARFLNQVSVVGRWLDPVADRLALIVVAATFVVQGIAPNWLVYIIVIPDVILVSYGLLLFHGSPDLPVSKIGKVRTALLLLGTPLLLLHRVPGFDNDALLTAATVILALGCAGHLLAFVDYLRKVTLKHRQLKLMSPPEETSA